MTYCFFIFRRCTRDWGLCSAEKHDKTIMNDECDLNGEKRSWTVFRGYRRIFKEGRSKYRAPEMRITSITHSIKLLSYELAVGLYFLQVFLHSPPDSVN